MYTSTVCTYIIMSGIKFCIIFPLNGLYIMPLPLSASVQAHAALCNQKKKKIQITPCTLETPIQFHCVSKPDIALVFSPGLTLQFFFFFSLLTSSTWCLRINPGDGRREIPACSSSGTSHKRCSGRGRRCLQLQDHTHL